eukprot:gnl/TRDRNA2_/TRDRNA2_173824_c0_seq1.p1 gnl/TRDRNA2_/TRDRNA2_173824_c0~~gnl/TRDRNA2_/TRDRNA2_173824_c0_seq1.p1  ORF type:complete len:187 (-),score=20.73 gnl/TRDRNA2_/TRDRNA2_173824_c0_seq1:119-679(-)
MCTHCFFHIADSDETFAQQICTDSLRERAIVVGQECFHFATKSEKMIFVYTGDLDYFVGPESCGTPIHVGKGACLCEMVLWMEWFYRGNLMTQTAVELIELDAADFHRKIKQRGSSFRLCREYAERYMELLLKSISSRGLSILTDIYGDSDALSDLTYEAAAASNIAGKMPLSLKMAGALPSKSSM